MEAWVREILISRLHFPKLCAHRFFSEGLKRVAFKAANLLFFLVGVATAGLGMWATGTDLKEVIAAGAASSFGCAAPV
jgi:hypothetical protein